LLLESDTSIIRTNTLNKDNSTIHRNTAPFSS
jgi:hypothetical protein